MVESLQPAGSNMPFMKMEDTQYFSKLLEDVDETELSSDEQKEREIMRLLLKIKNGTPPMRKVHCMDGRWARAGWDCGCGMAGCSVAGCGMAVCGVAVCGMVGCGVDGCGVDGWGCLVYGISSLCWVNRKW